MSRNVFHITEALGIEYLLVKYFLALGNTRQAQDSIEFPGKNSARASGNQGCPLADRAFFKFPNFVSRWLK